MKVLVLSYIFAFASASQELFGLQQDSPVAMPPPPWLPCYPEDITTLSL